MADQSGGEGWWIASDGKWYPPELHPDFQPPPIEATTVFEPPSYQQPSYQQPTYEAQASTPSYPSSPPGSPPPGVPSFEPASPSPPSGGSKTGWIVGGGIGIAALLGIGALLFTGGDDDSVATSTPTEQATGVATDAPSEEPTQVLTEEPTLPPTEEATEATAPPTEEPTDPPTEEPTDAPTEAPTDAPSGDVGSPTAPAAFGEEFQVAPDWRSTIVSAEDASAAGYLSDVADPAPSGSTYLAITYQTSYWGTDPFISDATTVRAIGATVYESFDSDCFLDSDALAAAGSAAFGPEYVPGQTSLVTTCVTVPAEEIPTLTYSLENFSTLDSEVIFTEGGGQAPDLSPPPDVSGHQADLQAQATAFGEDVEFADGWSAAVLSIEDAEGTGLLSFTDPPPAGLLHVVVKYRATYNGTEATDTDPFFLRALGSASFGTSTSNCFLDTAALEAAGLEDNFGDYVPGDSKEAAVCLTLPADEVDTVVIAITAIGAFDTIGLYYGG